MNRLKLVLLVAALTLPVSNAQALEWVDYDGTIPDNAVSVNEGTEDRPVCRKNSRIGIVNDSGKCYSVKVGGSISKKTQDDGYQILVDESATEDTEDTYTQAEYDAATDGMISQDAADELVEAAVAAATEGMYTADQYAAATDGLYTQAQLDAASCLGGDDCSAESTWGPICVDSKYPILEVSRGCGDCHKCIQCIEALDY